MKKILSALLGFMLISAMLLGLSACAKNGDEYVLTINGTRVSKGESMVYLYEQKKSFEERGGEDIWEVDFDGTSAQEVAKQNAVNSITLVKAALAQADDLDIKLSDEDEAEINTQSKALFDDMGEQKTSALNISEEDIRKIVRESFIQQRVYDLVTDGFVVNEDDFNTYFEEHYDSEISRYNNITIEQIYFQLDSEDSTAGHDKAMQAKAELNAGTDFDTVMAKYNPTANKGKFLLTDGMYDDDIVSVLYHTDEGSVTDVLEGADGYYIFKVVSIETPDMDSVREGLRTEYVKEKKLEIYQAQNEKWQADMKLEKNDEVYDSIEIGDC
jgi:foldase protein PrsA